MSKPHLIRISSQKGGVGKTTISVNLATALSLMGSNVLLIDFDLVNPSLGFHMGVESANAGIRSVLLGNSTLKNTIITHGPTGISVLAGEMQAHPHTPTKAQLRRLFHEISRTNYNFVIVDTPPGFLPEENLRAFGEAVIVTTPEASSLASAARLANHYDMMRLKHTLITNKFKNKRHEVHMRAIADMYDGNILAILPDDEAIPLSVAAHIPAYIAYPNSKFSIAMRELAHRYITKFGFEYSTKPVVQAGFFSRLGSGIIGIFQRR